MEFKDLCLFSPPPRWFLFDWITSGAESHNVHCSHSKAPVKLSKSQKLHCTSAMISVVIPLGKDTSTSFTHIIIKILMQIWLASWWDAAFFPAVTRHCVQAYQAINYQSCLYLCSALLDVENIVFVADHLVASWLGQTSSLLSLEEHYVNRSSWNH